MKINRLNFNCLRVSPLEDVYLLPSGDVLKWRKGGKLQPAAKTQGIANLKCS